MPYECSNCGNIYSRFSRLKDHLLSKHLDEDKFHCADCEKKVKEDSLLKVQCEVCEKQFVKKCQLAEHMTIHTKEKRFHCAHCKRTFRRKVYLAKHVMTHLTKVKDKPYQCNDCGYCSSQLSHLKLHIELRHVKPKKPFYCNICDKEFESSAHLHCHKVPDTEGRPYRCTECDLGFTKLGHLQEHLFTHRAEKPFLCSQCGKNFRLNKQLKVHSTIHRPSGAEKAYKCDNCGKAYISKASLKRHFIISHRSPKPRKKRTVKRVADKTV